MIARRTLVVAVGFASLLACSCAEAPTQPQDSTIPVGQWTGSGVCLTIAAAGCDLLIGCGHGQFPLPSVGADGTFQVQGTYRIVVGPVNTNPPPPALFAGVLKGQTLTLTVTPSDPSIQPGTYVLQPTNGPVACGVVCAAAAR